MSWIMRLAVWMDSRFPAKLVVKLDEYAKLQSDVLALHEELGMLRTNYDILASGLEVAVNRLATVESSAVHKGAVQDVISVVKAVKDEVATLKMGLGLSKMAQSVDPLVTFNDTPMEDSNG